VPVHVTIAEVGEWRLPSKRKPGRGRAGGRAASSERATAESKGTPGTGTRRQSRAIGAEPEKGFSRMEGISGRTSCGSFTETRWTRPWPFADGRRERELESSPEAERDRDVRAEPADGSQRRSKEREAARPAQRVENTRCGGTTDGEADRAK